MENLEKRIIYALNNALIESKDGKVEININTTPATNMPASNVVIIRNRGQLLSLNNTKICNEIRMRKGNPLIIYGNDTIEYISSMKTFFITTVISELLRMEYKDSINKLGYEVIFLDSDSELTYIKLY